MSVVKVEKNSYTVESLYQWDLNQVLTIYGLSLPSIPEIHFTNDAMDRAIVRQASMDSAGVITADVPNSLLQKAGKMKVYVCIYQGDTFTSLYKIEIQVKARNKPSDYTLVDDPEVYSFNALENQVVNALARVESLSSDAISKYNGATTALTEAKTAYENAKSDVDEAVDNAVDTAMSNVMPTLLSDETKELFGFGASAVPNNVFDFLGKYNLQWWKMRGYGAHYEAFVQEDVETFELSVPSSSGKDFYYSDTIAVSQTDGKISLVDPQMIHVEWGQVPYAEVIGKYVGVSAYQDLDTVYKFDTDVTFDSVGADNQLKTTFTGGTQTIIGIYVEETTDWEMVFSGDSEAYPQSGVADGFEYQYLGVPFENAVTAPKIATGSYTGTGTSGSSNPNSLTFDFKPKLVYISGGTTPVPSPYIWGNDNFLLTGGSTLYVCQTTTSGNSMSWYVDKAAAYQLNQSGITYHYIAIG